MTATLDLPEIKRYATWKHELRWLNPDKTPVNLTGCHAKLQARKTASDAVALITLSDTQGGITLGGALGTILLQLTSVQTSKFSWTDGVYDLVITLTNGEVVRLCEGAITVSQGVTR